MKAISLRELVLVILNRLLCRKLTCSLTDMLGFKLELPQREDGITKKPRPIYLDMQVNVSTLFCVNAVP